MSGHVQLQRCVAEPCVEQFKSSGNMFLANIPVWSLSASDKVGLNTQLHWLGRICQAARKKIVGMLSGLRKSRHAQC